MNKLVRYFADQNLSGGYDMLSEVALGEKINLRTLPRGHFVAFVNKTQTKVKLATGNDVIAYLRLEPGRKLDPRTIQHLPEFFNGTGIEYDKAMKKVLQNQFPKWFEKI